LERERQRDLKERPEDYKHVWEGGYLTAIKGSYYEAQLLAAEQDGRIGRVGADPLMRYRAFADIGGTGARSDNFVFWIAQFIGREVRVLNHYEVQGQPIGSHLAWMAKRKYTPDNTDIWLPHDGATFDRVIDVSYQSALIAAGYDVEVVPNMGKGAAAARIEAFRRVFPSCWFNAETTQPGRDALGWYHEKRDEKRDVGLGPEHDWASHSADAGGLGGGPTRTTNGRPATSRLTAAAISTGGRCKHGRASARRPG
jgi:phage terminase large subunit